VLRFSDLFSRRARLRHEAYPEYSRDSGIVDEAWLYLGPSLTHMVAVGFQSCGRDLSERDRTVLELLRPHLISLDANARTRRRLTAVLEALARSETLAADGVILLGRRREVEHASPAARRLVGRWFGELNGCLPGELEDWFASTARPSSTWIERGDRRLVVEAPNASALLLREEIVPAVALTSRERDVLRCVAAGRSTAETARLLWVTPATVSKHLEHVYEKLGVHSRTAALAALGMTAEPVRAELPALAAKDRTDGSGGSQ
jgi:DNA-binding CsgD family transcriptional regulator